VDVIRHHFQINDLVAVLLLFLQNEFLEALLDTIGQHFSAVLGAEDDMILTTVNNGMARLILFTGSLEFHRSNSLDSGLRRFYYRTDVLANVALKWLKREESPFIPGLKHLGFTGLILSTP
jgi:hypothetical protein